MDCGLWCVLSERRRHVERLWRRRLLITADEKRAKRRFHRLMRGFDAEDIDVLRKAVESGGWEAKQCAPGPPMDLVESNVDDDQPGPSGLSGVGGGETEESGLIPQIDRPMSLPYLCCKMWRWKELQVDAALHRLEALPWCRFGRVTINQATVSCCNPFHYALWIRPETSSCDDDDDGGGTAAVDNTHNNPTSNSHAPSQQPNGRLPSSAVGGNGGGGGRRRGGGGDTDGRLDEDELEMGLSSPSSLPPGRAPPPIPTGAVGSNFTAVTAAAATAVSSSPPLHHRRNHSAGSRDSPPPPLLHTTINNNNSNAAGGHNNNTNGHNNYAAGANSDVIHAHAVAWGQLSRWDRGEPVGDPVALTATTAAAVGRLADGVLDAQPIKADWDLRNDVAFALLKHVEPDRNAPDFWLYNSGSRALFMSVSTVATDGRPSARLGRDATIRRLSPGYCIRVHRPPEYNYKNPPQRLLTISVGRGWGAAYGRTKATDLPCRYLVVFYNN